MKDRSVADAIMSNCGKTATVISIERKEKTEKAPALYDLTTLQRDANRILGWKHGIRRKQSSAPPRLQTL